MKKFHWAPFMRSHPIFSGFDDQHVEWLLSDEVSLEHRFDPEDVIVREGDVGDSIFVVGSGVVEVVLCGAGRQNIQLAVMPAGETFGEMGFFEHRPRSATVRARDACTLLEIGGSGLRRLAETQPNFQFQVLLRVSERLRKNNEQILALHLEGAQNANRAKDEFLAMLGHELRNPLGAISTAIHLLDRLGKPDDQTAAMRDIIIRQIRHLTRLLDDLLDVSKLVSRKISLHRRPEDFKTLALRVLSSFEELGKTASHTVGIVGQSVMVDIDPVRLEQVVANLLDNALKYTPPGGRVDITITAEANDAVLSIRDTGAGIAADVLPRVFELFVQGNRTLDRSNGGLGVGLTLVKRLVELHGGTVAASSAGHNLGSEFVVRIPRLSDRAVGRRSTDVSAEGAHHIVIVEDNRDFRHGLRVLLESWGHRVEEAETGKRGLELLLASRPEIALIDLGLPDIDGYAVAQALRSSPGGEAMLLVAVTGYGRDDDRRRTRDVGFDAHLTKPVDPGTLAQVIASVPRAGSR